MAVLLGFPFVHDDSIETDVDFTKLVFFFYTDLAGENPVDFSLSTFSGEVLDEIDGTKLFDLSFNTPANDGKIAPSLTETQTATLAGKKIHYFVTVTTGSLTEPYWSGALKVSKNFKPGA